MTVENLGKKISGLREGKGWTQETLSVESKIARRTIQNIEGGHVMSPGIEVIAALAYALGTTVGELLGENQSNGESKADLFFRITRRLAAFDKSQLDVIEGAIADLYPSAGTDSKTTLAD